MASSGGDRSLFRDLGRASARVASGDAGAGSSSSSGSGVGGPGPALADDSPGRSAWPIAVGVFLAILVPSVALGWASLSLDTVLAVAALAIGVAAVVDAVTIVQAYERRALMVLGNMEGLLDPGLHLVPPFVSTLFRYDLRTQTLDVPRQEAITRDNSPVTANAVVYVRVTDAEKAFLGVDDYRRATLLLAQTTLRAVLGDMELDDTLSKREEINRRIHEQLDSRTDDWGVRVEAVEVREVKPSAAVEDAMEQQSAAERRRRAMILEAQGERRSAIERAQGARAANVIRAQGEKRSRILEAQGDAVATVLRARAAESMGERAVIEKGMETLGEIGASASTTYLLPQELTSLVGRYGRHLSGSDVADGDGSELRSGEFDEATRDLLGLDEITALAAGNGHAGDGHAADGELVGTDGTEER